MSKRLSHVIIGNGIAGVSAAETLRAADPTCSITIIADEFFPVYYRPALKDYLADRVSEDKLWARPSTFYQQHRIRFVPGHVVGIHPTQHSVQLHTGQRVGYQKLLLANGARARQLNCPGAHLTGITTLRTIADYQQVLRRLSDVKSIVILGSGTLALETAETLCQQGYKVTHLLRYATTWPEILDTTASDLVLQEERRLGIDVRVEEEIAEIVGKKGQVSGVITTRGKHISCEMVIAAIGIEPLIDFALASGIACGRGIQTHASMQTNIPDIYAAGDIVETTDAITGRTRVIGQWYPAIQQAQIAAYNMLDMQDSHQLHHPGTIYNATFLCGLDFASIGPTVVPQHPSIQELIAKPQPRTYRKVILHQGVPVGALFLGNRKNALACKRAIDHRVNILPIADRLFDDDFDLHRWLDQQHVPPTIVDTNPLSEARLPHTSTSKSYPGSSPAPQQSSFDAVLVPIPHPRVAISLQEIRLSQFHQGREGTIITLGRQQEASIFLDHRSVSHHHAEIGYLRGQYRLRDAGSANGIYINNLKQPLKGVYTLQDGDTVRFGDVRFLFQLRSTTPISENEQSPIVEGFGHRTNARTLTEGQVRFEIDMCIGCDRCMNACPVPLSSHVSIADLNQATVSPDIAPHVAHFSQECILCGSCVPVCPVDNHRDLLMVSLKQRLGISWEGPVDSAHLLNALPQEWDSSMLINRLREQQMLGDPRMVPENYLLHLVAASQVLTLAAGTTLLREGTYGRDLYLILDGYLALSATGDNEQEFSIAVLRPGEFFGEHGMLTGQPAPSTARAQTAALLLQVPEQAMQRLMELVPRIRSFFEQMKSTHSLTSILRRMALFQDISDDALHSLIEHTQISFYDRNERLFAEDGEHRPAREALHILLEGFVKVARQKLEEGGKTTSERIIAYRQGGDYFAGGLDLLGDSRAVTATAITRTRVAEVPQQAIQAIFQHSPEVKQRFKQRLQEYISSTLSMHTGRIPAISLQSISSPPVPVDAERKAGLHSIVSHGVVEGTEVLVIDLDSCIHCNECEEACARRHGHSRMNRKGMVIGNLNVVTACRQCQDPVCMLCSRAGIARSPDGEVYITESCIGCGICAERCPYNAISIVNVDENDEEASTSWQRFSNFFTKGLITERKRPHLPVLNQLSSAEERIAPGPLEKTRTRSGYNEMRKKLAIKCDLCAGYSDQACVQACPTGAAFRIKPTIFFGTTEDILRR
ncbi:MAG TPA: FAD-dependent oxidoreductase [Ktedonobacteraceae bacterium]|nr:FAD-dependent oxidoreductase [Ktedonobacteraceae bacterium]